MYGPQGSGKGTQAKLLAEKLHLVHISSGEMLRKEAKQNTARGLYLRRQLATGALTPISKLMEVFTVVLRRAPKNKGIIFDGFARQITEAKIFLSRTKKLGRYISAVILIEISSAETKRRLSKRGQCLSCGKIVILGGRLKIGGRCPYCLGKITRRTDDEPKAIERRLRLYKKHTTPVIAYFYKRNLVVKINGAQPVKKVHKDIISSLKKRKLIS